MMFAVLIGQLSLHTIARDSVIGKAICSTAMAFAFVICVEIDIERLTIMHLLMGQMALEAGARFANNWVTFCPTTKTDCILAFFFAVFNLMAGLDETFVHIDNHGSVSLHKMDRFAKTAFFKKQHCILHYTLFVLVCSCSTAFWQRLRYNHKVNIVRSFLEPACLVSIATLLTTHDHDGGTSHLHEEHLATHPVIAQLMYLAAFTQISTNILHLSYHEAPGKNNSCVSVKGGSTPMLKMSRLTNAFAHLLVANFLFVDTFMEYLGCRHEALLNGSEDTHIGLTLESEVSTYFSVAVMLAALTLGILIHCEREEHQATYNTLSAESEDAICAMMDAQEDVVGNSTRGALQSMCEVYGPARMDAQGEKEVKEV